MGNYETLEFFRATLSNLTKLFRVQPRVIAHDLHPQYITTQLAQSMPLPKIGVHHHHAHVVSCMAESDLEGTVLGVVLDGTGYGTDGAIWGGEFLLASRGSFERRGHFRYVPLPGGDAAVHQPWRMALSCLDDALAADAERLDLPL